MHPRTHVSLQRETNSMITLSWAMSVTPSRPCGRRVDKVRESSSHRHCEEVISEAPQKSWVSKWTSQGGLLSHFWYFLCSNKRVLDLYFSCAPLLCRWEGNQSHSSKLVKQEMQRNVSALMAESLIISWGSLLSGTDKAPYIGTGWLVDWPWGRWSFTRYSGWL